MPLDIINSCFIQSLLFSDWDSIFSYKLLCQPSEGEEERRPHRGRPSTADSREQVFAVALCQCPGSCCHVHSEDNIKGRISILSLSIWRPSSCSPMPSISKRMMWTQLSLRFFFCHTGLLKIVFPSKFMFYTPEVPTFKSVGIQFCEGLVFRKYLYLKISEILPDGNLKLYISISPLHA